MIGSVGRPGWVPDAPSGYLGGLMTEAGFPDIAALVAEKGQTTVTVAIPARNEADTIGPIVSSIRSALMDSAPLVDELVVVDDHSTDDTAAIARGSGALVLDAATVLPDHPGPGKGQALWKSLAMTSGDVIVWCDADVDDFDPTVPARLIAPMLRDPDIGFVKANYDRPPPTEGGRVTEILARPLIATLFPHLAWIGQPLSGEFGGRRRMLEALPFRRGYDVDLALLIDLSERFGVNVMRQVELGPRLHRSRALRDLGPQATEILLMALDRAGVERPDEVQLTAPLRPVATVTSSELPPVASVVVRP